LKKSLEDEETGEAAEAEVEAKKRNMSGVADVIYPCSPLSLPCCCIKYLTVIRMMILFGLQLRAMIQARQQERAQVQSSFLASLTSKYVASAPQVVTPSIYPSLPWVNSPYDHHGLIICKGDKESK
jgi:hypothetical protein